MKRITIIEKLLMVVLILTGLVTIAPASAELDPRAEAKLILAALAHDRNLAQRAGESVVIGVLAGPLAETYVKAIESYADKKIAGLPISVRLIPNSGDLAASLASNGASCLIITSIDKNLSAVLTATGKAKTLSFAAGGNSSSTGISIKLAGGRPKFVINLATARNEGVDFNSGLLSISEVLK